MSSEGGFKEERGFLGGRIEWLNESRDELAKKVSHNELMQRTGGFWSWRYRDIIVPEYARVVFVVDGVISKILGPGKHDLGGIWSNRAWKGERVEAIFMDYSDIEGEWYGAWGFTKDTPSYKVGIKKGALRFKLVEPAKFYANFMAFQSVVKRADFLKRIMPEVASAASSVLRHYSIEDLWGNLEVRNDCRIATELEAKNALSRWGLEIIDIVIHEFGFPPEWLDWKEKQPKRVLERDDKARDFEDEVTVVQRRQELDRLERDYQSKMDMDEIAQALEIKRRWDQLLLETKRGGAMLDQEVQDRAHLREMDRVKTTESEKRDYTRTVLQSGASPEAMKEAMEARVLEKTAEGDAKATAEAMGKKHELGAYKEAQETTFRHAAELVERAKTPPAQPVIMPPAYPPPYQPSSPNVVQQPTKTCPNGHQNRVDSKFCAECGAKFQ